MKNKILILGGGESGIGAAYLASKKGYEVFLSDYGQIKDQFKKILKENNMIIPLNIIQLLYFILMVYYMYLLNIFFFFFFFL